MLSKLKLFKNNSSTNNINTINFEMLPAERKSRPAVAMCMGCTSCCCCCCCVHTAGGIIGAAIATKAASNSVSNQNFIAGQYPKYNYNQQNQAINDVQTAKESVKKVTMAYWITLGILSAISFPITFLVASKIELTAIAYFGVVLPIMQIVTFFISLLALLVVPDRNIAFKALLKIAGGSFIGIILGIMVMITGAIAIGVF